MSFIVKEEKKKFELVPEGLHHGVCVWLFDLGTHMDTMFNKEKRCVRIAWELPDVRVKGTKDGVDYDYPKIISKEYNLSMNEKSTLRKHLESWRGRKFTDEEKGGFDLQSVLGVNCMVQIIHDTKGDDTYANINAILPLYKGMETKSPESKSLLYTLGDSPEIPSGTPDWIRDKILKCKELTVESKESVNQCSDVATDNVPF
jgi:hypothetical protein